MLSCLVWLRDGCKVVLNQDKMVMTNQTDLLDLIFGEKPGTVSDAGELNFYVPAQRELDQQLDQQLDTDLLFDSSDLRIDHTFMEDAYIADDICVPSEEVVIDSREIPPQETPPSTSGSDMQQELIFQFPPNFENESFQSLLASDDINIGTDLPPTSPSTPFSPGSSTPFSPGSSYAESLPPPTPDTASSMDSIASNIPTFLKQGLKHGLKASILEKRRRAGKEEIKVEFVPPAPEQLTPEEVEKRKEKRERNKLAAQRCRSKKRQQADVLEDQTKRLEKDQSKIKLEIQQLIDERDYLIDLLKIHSTVCPELQVTFIS